MSVPTYDENRMAAVLTRCGRCLRAYYMTHPQTVCIVCRRRRDEAA